MELHEWALREAGTDPDDIPGGDDLQTIEQSYLDTGGDFLVGIADEPSSEETETFDGTVVAMGGFLPSERGYEDERRVSEAAELHRMRVAPPVQGNGYGRELLTALETRIKEEFDTALATTAVRQRQVVSFYRDAGYSEVDRSTFREYELVHFEKSLADGV